MLVEAFGAKRAFDTLVVAPGQVAGPCSFELLDRGLALIVVVGHLVLQAAEGPPRERCCPAINPSCSWTGSICTVSCAVSIPATGSGSPYPGGRPARYPWATRFRTGRAYDLRAARRDARPLCRRESRHRSSQRPEGFFERLKKEIYYTATISRV